ncbi:MAG: hypothetical protein JNJ54_29950 [Myxococcaceae bacterium]|nr:hypothetical protein [Myxococcaceae bacterium]
MLLLPLLLAASPTLDANSAGMKLYRAQKYPEAAEQFRAAIRAGEREAPGPTVRDAVQLTRQRALAQFNLGCTLALLRKAGRVCEFDAYRSAVVEAVQQAITLDPGRLEKALVDPDLAGVRDTLAFQSWKGLSPSREGDLTKLLHSVRWWSVGAGVFGSIHELTFSDQGFALTMKVFDQDGNPLERRKTVYGKWALAGRTLTLFFPVEHAELKKARSFEGTFTDEGQLVFKGWVEFSDAPSECDA